MKELLKELFERYYRDVYTYLYGLSHDASLSEDLASEVFLEVVKSIATFRGEADIKTWLFSIARHQWYAHLKKKKRHIPTESIHELYDSNFIGMQPESFSNEVEQLICELLKEESELSQKIFQMRLEGYSYYEIALKLEISESSARVVFFRAKAKIKKMLEREGYLS